LKRLRDTYSDLIRKRYPNIPRRVSGYNLNYLLPENGFHVARALVGSEGTCVTVLEASCRLVESPPERVLLVIAYPDIFQCADRVPEIMAHHPIGLEGIDELLVEFSRRRQLNRGRTCSSTARRWLAVR
jgi:FAD/FMN-containing dehydrogenase